MSTDLTHDEVRENRGWGLSPSRALYIYNTSSVPQETITKLK